ncbi:hypothetical protein P7K49_009425 [Saguinus oedipus]|uniref:Uncharacterized protein n=1 Tax=Saguinus oedipus TaxID=9490 RepID=A0ABQ9VJX2_SAGOE|nr:hypothetical protein P7K49_009425 [Saguinus oedipus]
MQLALQEGLCVQWVGYKRLLPEPTPGFPSSELCWCCRSWVSPQPYPQVQRAAPEALERSSFEQEVPVSSQSSQGGGSQPPISPSALPGVAPISHYSLSRPLSCFSHQVAASPLTSP